MSINCRFFFLHLFLPIHIPTAVRKAPVLHLQNSSTIFNYVKGDNWAVHLYIYFNTCTPWKVAYLTRLTKLFGVLCWLLIRFYINLNILEAYGILSVLYTYCISKIEYFLTNSKYTYIHTTNVFKQTWIRIMTNIIYTPQPTLYNKVVRAHKYLI